MKDANVTVGAGRGFLAKLARRRGMPSPVVITAAHCLPWLPPPHPWRLLEERTYPTILGPRGASPTVWAECLFADPMADVAVLGEPDNQELSDQCEAYAELMMARPTLPIATVTRRSRARLLTLDGQWAPSVVDISRSGRSLTVFARVASGMSGSPIVHRGCAVGVISAGDVNPSLAHHLPPWVLGLLRIRPG